MMMNDIESQLPWESLKHTDGDIPWLALEEFANSLTIDWSVSQTLMKVYEDAWNAWPDYKGYEDLYIPAIFALAASNLNDEKRSEIGKFLLEKLSQAGQDNADISMEVLMAACGSMGPVILPDVLDIIRKEPNQNGAWFQLWGLTELAVKTEDSIIRSSVIQACTELLQQADSGHVEIDDAFCAAQTLALLKHTSSRKLLKRLEKKAEDSFFYGDYEEALLILENRLDYSLTPNMWEQPVKEWFEPRWKMARKWYQEHKEDDFEEDDVEAGSRRAALLAERFIESEYAHKLADDIFDDAGFISHNVLEYAWTYAGSSPEEIDEHTLEEVLLDVFPRKVTAERELFENVAPVTETLLKWLESEGILTDTKALAETVHGWADIIVANAMNPQNWGMGKSFMMQAKADGVDMGDQEAIQRYIAKYNSRLDGGNLTGTPDSFRITPPIPIVNISPKTGRNEPCPCGSGKKYKKCCGGTNKINL
ncbi:MAG: SEC-C domain-containing protein [Sedimentisphaerales bacterium]|nr:SEC-C domain-containing protein [Sedimentisphaerales bacterium]